VKYEWDAAKNAANVAKHGVDFEDAIGILKACALETPDNYRDYGEERITALGIVQRFELFVVYTMRGRNRRIISARRASRHERETYYQAVARIGPKRQD
jgi:uncharacterized protein